MSKIKIERLNVEEEWCILRIVIKVEKEKDINIKLKYTREGIFFKQDSYNELDKVERAFSIIRGFIKDKRNYQSIKIFIDSKMRTFGIRLNNPFNSSDKRRSENVLKILVKFDDAIKEKMGISALQENLFDLMINFELNGGVSFEE